MKSKLYCMKHNDEVLKYFFETCKELSCIDCLVLNQKLKHSCVAVSEFAEKQRETLQSSWTTLDEKVSKGRFIITVLNHASQPRFSTTLLNHSSRPRFETTVPTHASQPRFSTTPFLNYAL